MISKETLRWWMVLKNGKVWTSNGMVEREALYLAWKDEIKKDNRGIETEHLEEWK